MPRPVRRSLRPFPALLFCFLIALPAAAGIDRFTPFGPPSGDILALTALPATPGRLLASTDQGGVFVSPDRGRSWIWSGLGLGGEAPRAFLVDPLRPRTVYGATRSTFYRSSDGGRSWKAIASGQTFAPPLDALGQRTEIHLAIGPPLSRPPVLFLATGRQIFRSPDGGATWDLVLATGAAAAFSSLVVDPSEPRTVYAGLAGDGGLWVSRDSGGTWSEIDAPPGGFAGGVNALVFAALRRNGRPVLLAATPFGSLWRSLDRGAIWEPTSATPEEPLRGLTTLAVDPQAPSTLYAANADSFFVSRDAGLTWVPSNEGLHVSTPRRIVVDPGTRSVYVHDFADLYANSPRLGRWSLFFRAGLEGGTTGRVHFRDGDPSTAYVVLGDRVFRGADGGTRWVSLSMVPPVFLYSMALDLAFDPQIPGRLYMATDQGLLVSRNGGATWTSFALASSFVRSLALPRPGILLAGTVNGLMRSADGGATWMEVLAPSIVRLVLGPVDPEVVYAESLEPDPSVHPALVHHNLYATADGGLTWRSLRPDTIGPVLVPKHPATLYAAGIEGLLVSADRGVHWNPVGSGAPPGIEDLLLDPSAPAVLYAATGEGVWRSPDAGATWESIAFAPPLRHGIADPHLASDPGVPHRIFAGMSDLYIGRFPEDR